MLVRSERIVGSLSVEAGLPGRVMGVMSGWLEIDGDRVVAVGEGSDRIGSPRSEDYDLGDHWVVPGFVDIHVHGGGGHTFQAGTAAAAAAAGFHRAHGTTTLLASLVSAPVDELVAAAAALAPLVTDGTVAGVHLEGPFLAGAYCGAHDPAYLHAPDPAELARLLAAGPDVVRMVTLAPELAGGIEAVKRIVAAGVVAAIGHTASTYEGTLAAVAAGVTVATHLCNRMPPVDHRAPGPVVACLAASGVAIELIADGVHLHEAVVRDVFRVAGRRTVLVTDAMAAAGVGDGSYTLGNRHVEVRDGAARLANGALAGSVLTLDQALRNAVRFGVPALDAIDAVTAAPARAVGLAGQAGVLAPGRRADLVVLDDRLDVVGVLAAGEWIVGPAR